MHNNPVHLAGIDFLTDGCLNMHSSPVHLAGVNFFGRQVFEYA